MTHPLRTRRALPLLILLIALAAVFLFADTRARRTQARLQDSVDTSDMVIHDVRDLRLALNKDLASMRQGSRSAYARFLNNHRDRMLRLSALEARAGGLDPAFAATRDLQARLIRYVGLQQSMELTMRACYESLLFSTGAAMENACYDPSVELLFRDSALTGRSIKSLRGRLARASWLNKALMKSSKPPARAATDRPNILIVLLDAARADALGAYGSRTGATPFLDRIASQGVVFEDVTAPSAVTHISVASLFSGVDPFEAGAGKDTQWNYKLSLIPQFTGMGYHTAGFSANSLISDENHFEHGFEYFRDRYWPPAAVMINEVRSQAEAGGLPAPFLLYLHLIDPHDPYFSPDTVPALIRDGRPEGMEPDPNKIREQFEEKGVDARSVLPPENIAYLKDLYTQEFAYTDRWLDHLFSILSRENLLDNTLVIILADHGEQFLEHAGVKHTRMLYQELTHVPLILWGKLPPGLEPGTRVPEPHSLMEVLPSLLAWQGAPPKGTAGARATLFSGRAARAPIVSATWGYSLDLKAQDAQLIALRSGDFKLILDATRGQTRLFNLAKDPGETTDQSAALPEKTAALKKQALDLRAASLRASKKYGASGGVSKSLKKQLKTLGYTH